MLQNGLESVPEDHAVNHPIPFPLPQTIQFLPDISPPVLRFWTVWRVLGLMFICIFGGTILMIMSIVSVNVSSWTRFSVAITDLSLMTVTSIFLTIFSSFTIYKMYKMGIKQYFWALFILCVTWSQPYVNPISLGIRWSQKDSNSTEFIELSYQISYPRVSGFFSTCLLTMLFWFCFYEFQRFREERIYNRRRYVIGYFFVRIGFTLGASIDFGSVPVGALFTLMKYYDTNNPLPIARVVGITIVSFLECCAWCVVFVIHRNTKRKLNKWVYEAANDKNKVLQYGLTFTTLSMWTTQILVTAIVILSTPFDQLNSFNLQYCGSSVNAVGVTNAFMLMCWVFALTFSVEGPPQSHSNKQPKRKRFE